ncbi:lipoprotein signal peptidase [Neisseria shayeganii]|uniref:lipoprotein signal peptidase n=1 Tax=Neisseria shayeganii TaxID=607712 RepID=UPI001FD0C180|nr:lipoprotein signal peptidase [Neisseria shayeganii]
MSCHGQNNHPPTALCAARSLAYLYDMSSLAALLRLELHPHLGVLQRSQAT